MARLWQGVCSVSLTEVAQVRFGRIVELQYVEDFRSKVFPVVKLGGHVLVKNIVVYRHKDDATW